MNVRSLARSLWHGRVEGWMDGPAASASTNTIQVVSQQAGEEQEQKNTGGSEVEI